MRNRGVFSAVTILALGSIIGTVILFVLQLVSFSRLWAYYPARLTIAGVAVGGLDRQQAAERLLSVYSLPVEMHYGAAAIQLAPSTIGFELDIEAMLAAAEQERVRTPFWVAFWDYLWQREPPAADIPLRSTYSEDRLRAYLTNEIAIRYDQPATPAIPQSGTVNFQAGKPGLSLDVERSIFPIENALQSPLARIVELPIQRASAPRPPFENLSILLRQTVELSGFDGVVGVYLMDLQSGQETSFIYNQLIPVSTPPDVAFTASSTIKLPVMVSLFRRLPEEPSAEVSAKLHEMIAKSINPSTDWLMQNILDTGKGPLMVTQDLKSLGLDNTFLAGYFYDGAPLLQRFVTVANQRPDVNTDLDPYNQTTPTEIGMLLTDVYLCAKNGGGSLIAAFPNEITPAKCQTMINYLAEDKIGVLIQYGVPDGTRVAHKHGWVADAYYVPHNISDAAIVYTPGGDFVLTVYLYHPAQIVFEPANELIGGLARAAYNFYNLPPEGQ